MNAYPSNIILVNILDTKEILVKPAGRFDISYNFCPKPRSIPWIQMLNEIVYWFHMI